MSHREQALLVTWVLRGIAVDIDAMRLTRGRRVEWTDMAIASQHITEVARAVNLWINDPSAVGPVADAVCALVNDVYLSDHWQRTTTRWASDLLGASADVREAVLAPA